MAGFLDVACADARTRIDEASRLTPLTVLRAHAELRPPVPSLSTALAGAGVSVIAEVKRASPSKGHLAWIPDVAAHAGAYAGGGAAAISVLTEPAHFHGTLADLAVVASAVDVPCIRKDFLIEPYQVWEARAAGAAAVLLIVAALDDETLVDLLRETRASGLEALIEVHSSAEAARIAPAADRAGWDAPLVVGVNARDLVTLTVDPQRFASVVGALPEGALAVAESGVTGPADLARAAEAGAAAVLVGEAVATAADPRAAVRTLVDAGTTASTSARRATT